MNVNFTLVLIDEPGLEKVRKDIRLLKGEEYLPGNLIGITSEIIPERVNVWIIENYRNVDSDIQEAFSSHAKNIVHCYLEVVGAREVLTVDRDSLNDFWGADSEEDKIAQLPLMLESLEEFLKEQGIARVEMNPYMMNKVINESLEVVEECRYPELVAHFEQEDMTVS